jgi:3-dehydroquinate dehydratase-1
MICVSISHMAQINSVLQSDAEMIELRLDLIKEEPRTIYSRITGAVKSVATCRPDGYSEGERITLLKGCMDLGASFVDIEVESSASFVKELTGHAKSCGTELIISYHNFEQTPPRQELTRMLNRCYERGGAIAKIATRVNSLEDTRNLISLYDFPGRKVVIGMGEKGRITRVMAPFLGAEFTFASPESGGETAPGQLSVSQLNELYKMINQS